MSGLRDIAALEDSIAAHVSWIYTYLRSSTRDNWEDMRMQIDRQIGRLGDDFDKYRKLVSVRDNVRTDATDAT